MPKKVDQFSHPQASYEAATIDSQGEQKLLLDFGPFAGEPSAEQLSPSEPGLFHVRGWVISSLSLWSAKGGGLPKISNFRASKVCLGESGKCVLLHGVLAVD
jgi:hypothetical protein